MKARLQKGHETLAPRWVRELRCYEAFCQLECDIGKRDNRRRKDYHAEIVAVVELPLARCTVMFPMTTGIHMLLDCP